MCGIIGIVDKKNCINDLISSLSRLEYRGYDSAGIATLNKNKFVLNKSKGKLSNLRLKIKQKK